MDSLTNRAWAEVSLDAIAHNIRQVRSITSTDAKIMAVVKADGYGHGFLEVAKTLIDNGADALGVAVLDEAKQLRSRGIRVPILVLGSTDINQASDLIKFDVIPTVFDYSVAKAVSDAAVASDKEAKIHIKIDTGMSRIGFLADDVNNVHEIVKISRLPNLIIEGIFTHFACADERDSSYTLKQFDLFMNLVTRLEEKGLYIPIKHVCNSAALIKYPKMHLNMVRPGIILYGLNAGDMEENKKISLVPAMQLKAKITMVKQVGSQVGVSYGKVYTTKKTTKIATVPIGYADGYSRTLTGSAKMCISKTLVPVIGKICMDQCMIDVTNVNNILAGDQVTIIGNCGENSITADDLAGYMGTVNYEVVCIIGKRIPRVYTKDGRVVKTLNQLV